MRRSRRPIPGRSVHVNPVLEAIAYDAEAGFALASNLVRFIPVAGALEQPLMRKFVEVERLGNALNWLQNFVEPLAWAELLQERLVEVPPPDIVWECAVSLDGSKTQTWSPTRVVTPWDGRHLNNPVEDGRPWHPTYNTALDVDRMLQSDPWALTWMIGWRISPGNRVHGVFLEARFDDYSSSRLFEAAHNAILIGAAPELADLLNDSLFCAEFVDLRNHISHLLSVWSETTPYFKRMGFPLCNNRGANRDSSGSLSEEDVLRHWDSFRRSTLLLLTEEYNSSHLDEVGETLDRLLKIQQQLSWGRAYIYESDKKQELRLKNELLEVTATTVARAKRLITKELRKEVPDGEMS